MIRSKVELRRRGVEIDLSGPDGNANVLLAAAKRFCRDLSIDAEPILQEMRSGSYEQLVEVFEREFGDFVTLYR